jgi:hypothetical protein
MPSKSFVDDFGASPVFEFAPSKLGLAMLIYYISFYYLL